MRRLKLVVVTALAASTIGVTAAPAQARCHPDFAAVCRVIVLVCEATGRPCAA
ncbi:MAG TPA: hypothetical protein VHN37_08170 [Actinomycetota bacterium]|nr:hypothetical protein [Actinomycetota bacterium]